MAGSQAAVLQQRPQKVDPKLIPPRGARPVDVFDDGTMTGAIVYEMEVIDFDEMKRLKTQAVSPVTGELLWKKNVAGQPIVPVLRLPKKPPKRKKRFILRSYQTGAVRMIENFEPDPEKQKAHKEREQVEAFADDLAREAIRRGFSNAAEMMAAILGGVPEEGEVADMVDEADELAKDPDALFDEEDDDIDLDSLVVEPDPNFNPEANAAVEEAAGQAEDPVD